jgi:hypothetical protein
MRTVAVMLFGAGLLLAVQVMFFGVRREVGTDAYRTREWPFAIAVLLATAGALLYFEVWRAGGVTFGTGSAVFTLSMLAGAGARWIVRQSARAAEASPDPDEDPRYKFQGHVARVVVAVVGEGAGKVEFVIDGRSMVFAARWLPGTTVTPADGVVGSEVVVEHVDGDMAFVEPWALVEGRL